MFFAVWKSLLMSWYYLTCKNHGLFFCVVCYLHMLNLTFYRQFPLYIIFNEYLWMSLKSFIFKITNKCLCSQFRLSSECSMYHSHRPFMVFLRTTSIYLSFYIKWKHINSNIKLNLWHQARVGITTNPNDKMMVQWCLIESAATFCYIE